MAIVTPDYETDLMTRAAALAPALFVIAGARNAFPGVERQPDGGVPLVASFFRFVTERRRRTYNGQVREALVQLLMRFGGDGFTPDARAAAFVRARAAYDALHQSGRFAGGTGAAYLDVVAEDAPAELPPSYFAMTFALWHYG